LKAEALPSRPRSAATHNALPDTFSVQVWPGVEKNLRGLAASSEALRPIRSGLEGLVSATTVSDVCIRADAKSTSAGTSSGQPFQVEQVGRVCLNRLVSTGRVARSVSLAGTMSACGRMQNLPPLERHQVNHLRSYKSVVSAPPIRQSVGVYGPGHPLGVRDQHVRCLHPGGCEICTRKNVIALTIPGRTSSLMTAWACQ
jgi:hypothetical protein